MLAQLRSVPALFAQPVRLFHSYSLGSLRADLVAGATVGLVLLPQSLAFSLLAGLPPEMGLYSAVVASIVGALWGSSSHLHSGPTNTASILAFSVLLPIAEPGSPQFIAAAGLIAVIAGLIRVLFGLARLGMLVNFVSDSVAVGFTAGAGILIISNQIQPILRIQIDPGASLVATLVQTATQIGQIHLPSLILGIITMALLLALPRIQRKLPSVLIGVVVGGLISWGLGLESRGVRVLGELPRSLPPLASLPLFDLDLIGHLANGALALAIIGLVEAVAIARAVSSNSRQRLDSNQEFIGQGLANIAAGFFSGYPCSGSFNRSALSYQSGARSALGNAFSGGFVLLALFTLAPFIAHLPRAVLAGALVVTAYSMIDSKTIARILRGAPGDAVIMIVTLLTTLVLPLQFAVLIGVLMSLGYYLLRTSVPRVQTVLPHDQFRHWTHQPEKPNCPQMPVVDLLGDLYFGAANHVEESLYDIMQESPQHRLLLLRMHSVQHCDISGIRALENIRRICLDRGGDLYFVRVREPVLARMRAMGFYDQVGADHFLDEDIALGHLFHHVIDPAICIYECEVRAFYECQNLPKLRLPSDSLVWPSLPKKPPADVPTITPIALWSDLRGEDPPVVVDVREPREFKQGHIPGADMIPLAIALSGKPELPHDRPIILVCRSGRRSARAAIHLREQGYANLRLLQGGMLAWESANLLQAVDV